MSDKHTRRTAKQENQQKKPNKLKASSIQLSSLEISSSNRRRIENKSESSQSQFLIFDPALKSESRSNEPLKNQTKHQIQPEEPKENPKQRLYTITLPSTGETVYFTKAEFIAYHLALNNAP